MIKRFLVLCVIWAWQCLFTLAFAFDLDSLRATSPFPANLNHQKAFTLIGDELVSSGFLALERKDLTILYPGAGSHVAILKLGQEISAKLPLLHKIKFVITDISENSFQIMRDYIHKLSSNTAERKTEFAQGYEVALTFTDSVSQVEYEIVYALNRADPRMDIDNDIAEGGRSFYYRQGYFDEADVVIHHDSSDSRVPSTFLSDFMLSEQRSSISKKRAIIFEDLNKGKSLDYYPANSVWINYDLLKGNKALIAADFGCHENRSQSGEEDDHLGTAKFRGAVVYYPEPSFWKSMSSLEIKTLLLLALTNTFSDTGPFNPEGIHALILQGSEILTKQIIPSIESLLRKFSDVDPELKKEICTQINEKPLFQVPAHLALCAVGN